MLPYLTIASTSAYQGTYGKIPIEVRLLYSGQRYNNNYKITFESNLTIRNVT